MIGHWFATADVGSVQAGCLSVLGSATNKCGLHGGYDPPPPDRGLVMETSGETRGAGRGAGRQIIVCLCISDCRVECVSREGSYGKGGTFFLPSKVEIFPSRRLEGGLPRPP